MAPLHFAKGANSQSKIVFSVNLSSARSLEISQLDLYKYVENTSFTDDIRIHLFSSTNNYPQYLEKKVQWILNAMPGKLKGFAYLKLLEYAGNNDVKNGQRYFQLNDRKLQQQFNFRKKEYLKRLLQITDENFSFTKKNIGKTLMQIGYPHRKSTATPFSVYRQWKDSFLRRLQEQLRMHQAQAYEYYASTGQANKIQIAPRDVLNFHLSAKKQLEQVRMAKNSSSLALNNQIEANKELSLLIDINSSKSLFNNPFTTYNKVTQSQIINKFTKILNKPENRDLLSLIDISRKLAKKYTHPKAMASQIISYKIDFQLNPLNLEAYLLCKLLKLAQLDLSNIAADGHALATKTLLSIDELMSLMAAHSPLIEKHKDRKFSSLVAKSIATYLAQELKSDDVFVATYAEIIIAHFYLLAKKFSYETKLGFDIKLYAYGEYKTQNIIEDALRRPIFQEKLKQFKEELKYLYAPEVMLRLSRKKRLYGMQAMDFILAL